MATAACLDRSRRIHATAGIHRGSESVPPLETLTMTPSKTTIRTVLLAVGAAVVLSGCTPTIRLQVDPIQIYARLDADVRVRLDQELRDLLVENPNLF
jgi:hypothetical protein